MDQKQRLLNLLDILQKRPQDEAMLARIARVKADLAALGEPIPKAPRKKKVVVKEVEVEVEE
jgi:heme oxygenase